MLLPSSQSNLRDTLRKATQVPAFRVSGPAPLLAFPDGLRSSKLPYVKFSTFGSAGKEKVLIALPVPPGLTVGDGMSYSTINLGIIGTIMSETMTQMAKQTSLSGALGAGVGGMVGSVINKAGQLNAAMAASMLARKFGAETVADTIDFSQRQVVAPNTNTTFQNSNIRSYAFTFKLVARTKKEAESIKFIVEALRCNMYPEGKDVILSYPPVWSIKFIDSDDNQSKYLPRIWETYLTSLTTTFNASTNIFHEDGSPVETDVSLAFQETRALTADDIRKLQSGETHSKAG